MTFEEILDQAVAMLQRRNRIAYPTLKRQFNLDDDALADLKEELIYSQRLAVDEDGRVLVWRGETRTQPVPSNDLGRPPRLYTPAHLVEKILLSKVALEGERKQVTVLFADLKGSLELLADRDPEEARQILDPVLERMMAAVHRYEGTVNQVMGDGIMALFGAPITHEDHAVRGCYAALAMQEAIRRYSAEVRREPCPRGRRGADCRGHGSPRDPHGGLVGGRSAGLAPRRPVQGSPPTRTGHGHRSGGGPPALFSLDDWGPGRSVHPMRALRRHRATTHAGDGTDHGHGNGRRSDTL
jgi:Adenylate and Guanylate cyclase catalytic domain